MNVISVAPSLANRRERESRRDQCMKLNILRRYRGGQFVPLTQHREGPDHGQATNVVAEFTIPPQDIHGGFKPFFHAVCDDELDGELIGELEIVGRFLKTRAERLKVLHAGGFLDELQPILGPLAFRCIRRNARQHRAGVCKVPLAHKYIGQLNAEGLIVGLFIHRLLQHLHGDIPLPGRQQLLELTLSISAGDWVRLSSNLRSCVSSTRAIYLLDNAALMHHAQRR